MRNQDLLDAVSMLSFVIGLANYEENLTQTDKAELMDKLDRQTRDILTELQHEIQKQNKLLHRIIELLEEQNERPKLNTK